MEPELTRGSEAFAEIKALLGDDPEEDFAIEAEYGPDYDFD